MIKKSYKKNKKKNNKKNNKKSNKKLHKKRSYGKGGYFTGKDYLKCPYCKEEFNSSRDIVSIGPRKAFTTVARRLYGCPNCRNILGVGTSRT